MELRAKFIIDMYQELKRVQPELISNEELRIFVNDIRKYLGQNKEDYETNQRLLGMKYLFVDL